MVLSEGAKMQIPCDIVREYEVSSGITAISGCLCGPGQQERRDVANSTWCCPSAAVGMFTGGRTVRASPLARLEAATDLHNNL
jgi:hypothetical protein